MARRTRIVEEVESVLQPGEGVEQFEARLRLSLAQPREVATADAATCDFEIVARATGDARQLRLPFVRFAGGLCVRERKRESGVAFYLSVECVRGVGCLFRAPVASRTRAVFKVVEHVDECALRRVDLRVVRSGVICVRASCVAALLEGGVEEREGKEQSGDDGSRDGSCVLFISRGLTKEGGDADRRGGGEIDGDEFDETHNAQTRVQRMCQRRGVTGCESRLSRETFKVKRL